jgi:hypothetical protein
MDSGKKKEDKPIPLKEKKYRYKPKNPKITL